jgi:hypothetical protein
VTYFALADARPPAPAAASVTGREVFAGQN